MKKALLYICVTVLLLGLLTITDIVGITPAGNPYTLIPSAFAENVNCPAGTATVASMRWQLFNGDTVSFGCVNQIAGVFIFNGISYPAYATALDEAISYLSATDGGIVDARYISGTQTIPSTLSIDRPVNLMLGMADFTCSATPCFTVSNDLVIQGTGRGDDSNDGLTSITSANNGTIFAGSGTVRNFKLKSLALVGVGNAVAITTPSFGGGNDWDGVDMVIDSCTIREFAGGSYAVTIGQSTNTVHMENVWFEHNTGHVDIGWASDTTITSSDFWRADGTNPGVRVKGGSHVVLSQNIHIKSSGTTTAADIQINADNTAGQTGFIWILDSKFGPEGEIAGRVKIHNYSAASTSHYSRGVFIRGNTFTGNNSTYAIHLENAIDKWEITGNLFSSIATALVNDNYTVPSLGLGQSIWKDNNIVPNGATAPTSIANEFVNGGRGFSYIGATGVTTQDSLDIGYAYYRAEYPELRNRIARSEELDNASWTKSGIVVTAGQADPFGGTTADLLTRAGGAGSERAEIAIDMTGSPTTLCASLWAKAGTISRMQVAIRDATAGILLNAPMFNLSSTWRPYSFCTTGIPTPANVHRIIIYPDGFTNVTAGTITVDRVQVNNVRSDYYKTTTTAASTSVSGTRFELRPIFRQGYLHEAVTFANLGTPSNGTVLYCSDCTIANPCAGAGTGAIAKRLNGVWVCN
jgi:hypothetical protein